MVKFIAQRIGIVAEGPPGLAHGVIEDDSASDDDFGSNFVAMGGLPDANQLIGGNVAEERVLAVVAKY